MKTIKRDKCAILHLVLKKRWFDLIDRAIKTEEYREAKPYWEKRISKWQDSNKPHVVEFQLGYAKNAPRMAFLAILSDDHRRRWMPEWGEPDTPHYVIELVERVNFAG